MWQRLCKRLIQLPPVLWGVSTLVFFLQRSIPGNPADAILGPDAPETAKAEWLHAQGFDAPVLTQYLHYLWGLLRLDLGKRFADAKPVWDVVAPRFVNTLSLALFAFVIALSVATCVGVLSAVKEGKWPDKLSAFLSLLAVSAPTFVLGTVMAWIFSVQLNWFPLMGIVGPSSYVLPCISVGLAMAAYTSRMVRSGLVDVLHEDYIRTAKAKGLHPARVIWKHALRNAFLPALTVLGLQLGVLLSGAVITEQIFSWPGLGTLTVEAVQNREYNVVSGCVLLMAFVYVLSNTLVDLLARVLDPRIRS